MEADLSQLRQVVKPLADIEITGVVDGGLGAQSTAFFVVLLDAGAFVVDVQGGHDAVGDDAGAKQAGRALADPTIKDELHLFRPADIEVFANHFFKEDAAGERSVENLGEGEFDLQDGQVVAISGLPVAGRKGMGQETQPLS